MCENEEDQGEVHEVGTAGLRTCALKGIIY